MPFVALLLLQRRPVAGRALLVTGSSCPGHGLCRSNVQEQTRRQVALLNATAQDLFSLYVSDIREWLGPICSKCVRREGWGHHGDAACCFERTKREGWGCHRDGGRSGGTDRGHWGDTGLSPQLKCQGEPFSSEADKLCNPSGVVFPPFRVNRTSERKEVMVAMYQLFAFLNASLGNITRDQEELNPTAKELLDRLHNTTKTTRGLISNLTCLLCKNYNIFQVDVSYGESSKGKGTFRKKQQGCQVLRKYVQVIAQAARVLLPHLSPP